MPSLLLLFRQDLGSGFAVAGRYEALKNSLGECGQKKLTSRANARSNDRGRRKSAPNTRAPQKNRTTQLAYLPAPEEPCRSLT
jgi:hypothetical protein